MRRGMTVEGMRGRSMLPRTAGRRKALGLLLAAAASGVACVTPAVAASPAPKTPTISSGYFSNVTFSSAVFFANVNAQGQPTNYYFQYGETSGYGAQTPLAPVGNGTIPVRVSQLVSGLKPATTYHFRIVASSPAGTSDGLDHSFTTKTVPLSLRIAGVPNPVAFGEPFLVEGTLTGTGSASHAVVLQANPFPFKGRLQAGRQPGADKHDRRLLLPGGRPE